MRDDSYSSAQPPFSHRSFRSFSSYLLCSSVLACWFRTASTSSHQNSRLLNGSPLGLCGMTNTSPRLFLQDIISRKLTGACCHSSYTSFVSTRNTRHSAPLPPSAHGFNNKRRSPAPGYGFRVRQHSRLLNSYGTCVLPAKPYRYL